jgi:hypothetical protein
MTTNFDRSNVMWRSINGKVPLPIDPKPIITIGPSKRASTAESFISDYSNINSAYWTIKRPAA